MTKCIHEGTKMIRFSEEIKKDMIGQAKKEYPNECCGDL